MFDRRVRQLVWEAELKLSQLLTIAVFGVDAVRLRRDVGNDGASLETDLHNLQVAEGDVDVQATSLRRWLRGDDGAGKFVCTLKCGTTPFE